MKHKTDLLAKAIEHEAAKLGLVFVSGPDPKASEVAKPKASINLTGTQERGVFLFAVAEE
jgi:hypothetical protein